LIFADVSVGVQEQSFDDPRFGSPSNFVWAGSLLWSPSRLTSVRAETNYEFIESFNAPSPGYWRTQHTLTLAHEIRHNLIGIVRALRSDRDFENINREDVIYGADLGLRYRIDRGLFAEAEYRYRTVDNSTTGSDYSRNIALARVRKAF
jgi:hypothetical protein